MYPKIWSNSLETYKPGETDLGNFLSIIWKTDPLRISYWASDPFQGLKQPFEDQVFSTFLFVPNSWSSGDLGLKYLFWGLKRDTTYTIYRGWIVYFLCKNMAKYRYLSSTSTCRQKCLRRTVSSSSSSSSSSLLLLLLLSSSSSSDMAALRVSPFFLAALRNWYTQNPQLILWITPFLSLYRWW